MTDGHLYLRPSTPPASDGYRRPPPAWRKWSTLDLLRRRQLAVVGEEMHRAELLGDELTHGAWTELHRLLVALVDGDAE